MRIVEKLNKLNINRLSANPTKWSNTLKQLSSAFANELFELFDNFVGLARKRLTTKIMEPLVWRCFSCLHRWLRTGSCNKNSAIVFSPNISCKQINIQNQPKKHQKKVWSVFKVNNKDTRIKPSTSFWYLYCYLEQIESVNW